MSYVMLSRVQSIEQLFIVGEVPRNKLYADEKTIKEVERLDKISLNKNPSNWSNLELDESLVRICFLNVRSIQKKFSWVESDRSIQVADVLFLAETWLDLTDTDITLPGFSLSLNSVGRGQGTATFYKRDFTLKWTSI